MSAPEKIWAIPAIGGGWKDDMGMWRKSSTGISGQAEYTRADLTPLAADYVAGLEAAKEFIAKDVSQWDEETLHENTSPQEAAQYIRDLNIPYARPSFVSDVMRRLRRFEEVTEDVEGTGVDIGRDWLDALTFLGLLERVRKSPASWQITDAGATALTARPASPDMRVVPLETLMRWQAVLLCSGVTIAEMIGRDVKSVVEGGQDRG